MKTIHKIICLICLLATTSMSYAASEAEYDKVSKAWTLKADGSQEYRFNMELTIFTHTAMNSTYGESFILYNPKYQEVKIHSSYTKQADGTIIKTPENAFVEVLPRFAADAPAYNHLKELVVVHTGLELGATIYLDYSILTKPGYYPALDIDEFLQQTSPVKNYDVSIVVPENAPLTWQLSGASVKGNEQIQEGVKTIHWNLRNIPASSREPFTPQNRDGVPHLTASTYLSFSAALSTLKDRLQEGLKMETEAFAEYITENAKNNKEKVDILLAHVVKNMATSLVPMGETGYTIRNVDAVLRSAYGTMAEKTQLLNVMLNAVGIPSEVIVVLPGYVASEASGLKAIKGLAIKVDIDGETRYLSAINQASYPMAQRGELDRGYTLTGKALTNPAVPTVIKENKEIIVDTSKAVNGYVVCTLPVSSIGMDSWRMTALNSERKEVFEIPSLLKEEIVYNITVEDGLELLSPTTPKTINKSFGSFTQTITQQGNKVEVKRTIELRKQQYTPAEYNDLRILINEWVNPTNRSLLFKSL